MPATARGFFAFATAAPTAFPAATVPAIAACLAAAAGSSGKSAAEGAFPFPFTEEAAPFTLPFDEEDALLALLALAADRFLAVADEPLEGFLLVVLFLLADEVPFALLEPLLLAAEAFEAFFPDEPFPPAELFVAWAISHSPPQANRCGTAKAAAVALPPPPESETGCRLSCTQATNGP